MYALQELIGIYAMQPDLGGSTQYNEQRSQRYEHLKELLAYWSERAGQDGKGISLGTLDTGLDYESTWSDILDEL